MIASKKKTKKNDEKSVAFVHRNEAGSGILTARLFFFFVLFFSLCPSFMSMEEKREDDGGIRSAQAVAGALISAPVG